MTALPQVMLNPEPAAGILGSTNPYTEIAMRRLSTLLIATTLALGLPMMAAAHDDDIDKINGTARVEAGQHAGDVSSVNGSVEIGDNAVVEKASTVNGSVELGDHAQAREVGTVNGAITLGASTRVRGEVNAVNGHIQLERGADVGGKLGNVNGAIELDAAHVAGGIETVSGDINVGANSHVEGGILVDKPHGWFNHDSRKPTVVIGPHAVVQGTLEFRRDVELKVSDSAQIGTVKGATPEKFSGATP
jgi:acyl-[acyl carrier protein]--UDP-N-acetylglucosamine O-acyltransferase